VSVVANVAINVDSRNAVTKLREVQTGAKATEQAFNALTQAAAAFGAGFALSKVIADVKELDTNLRRLGTVGGDVAALDKGLGQLSKNLDGVANKAELAAASYQALSAGFTETGANLRVVEAATKAAIGGLADTTQVTEVLVKTLNAYGLSGNEAIKVTDSISKSIELGNQEWTDYTSQLGRVVSVAAIAGVSIDELNAFIAAATLNGATAEIAFTGLGATLNTLLQPTKESQDAAKELGIQWDLSALRGKGLEALLTELGQKAQTNTSAAARLIGSQEALRGAFSAASKGGKDFSAALTSIQDATGKTDSDFQKMKESLANQLKALDTAFKNLSEALGKTFGPAVVDVVGDLTGAINGFADAINAIPQPVAAAAVEILKLLAQIILLQKTIQGIIALRAGFVAAMTGMAATTAATGTAATASSSAFALYTANTRTLQAAAAGATPVLAGLRGILASLASIGTIAIAVNIAVYGIQAVMQARAELDRLRGVRQAGGAAKTFGGSAPAESKEAARKTLDAIEAERKKNLPMQAIGQISGFGRGLGNTREQILAERERFARGVLALPTRRAQAGGLPTPTPTPQMAMPSEEDKAAKKAKDKAAQKEAQMQARLQGLTIETNAIQKQLAIREKITQAEIAGDQQLAARLQGEERNQQIIASLQSALIGVTDERERQALIAKTAVELDAAQTQTAGELAKIENARSKAIQDIGANLDMELIKLQANTDLKIQALQFLEIENQLKSQGITLTDQDAEAIRRKIAEINKAKKAQEEINRMLQMEQELFNGIAGTVANAFGGFVDAAISGTETLGDSDLLKTIGRMLIMYSIAQALGALGGKDGVGVFSTLAKAFGYKGERAKGGPVTSGSTYLVGERGPELFVPGRSGSIVPNDKMGGDNVSVIVNVDAKGSSVQGNDQQGNQLGRAISAAVQQELIKQKRPGGLLA
jgi:TP901 family phage tail tape measure protein